MQTKPSILIFSGAAFLCFLPYSFFYQESNWLSLETWMGLRPRPQEPGTAWESCVKDQRCPQLLRKEQSLRLLSKFPRSGCFLSSSGGAETAEGPIRLAQEPPSPSHRSLASPVVRCPGGKAVATLGPSSLHCFHKQKDMEVTGATTAHTM